jgi:hypothetical protein
LIGSAEKGDFSISGHDYEYTRDRAANTAEPGFFLGAGYLRSFEKGNSNIFAEIIWARSLIYSPGSELVPDPQYYYNQTFSMNVGYRYYLGKRK